MKPILTVILAVILTLPLATNSYADGNRLDQIIQTLTAKGANPIKSYNILPEYQSVDIQLDSDFWNGLDQGGQQQLGDMMARWDFLQRMNLVIAHLYINSTEVGTITPNMFGGGYSFTRK